MQIFNQKQICFSNFKHTILRSASALIISSLSVTSVSFAQEETLEPVNPVQQSEAQVIKSTAELAPVAEIENPALLSAIRSGKVGSVRLPDKDGILKFYQTNHGKFLWVKDAKFNSDAKKVFELIRDANTHGMNPENYYRSQLSQMIEGNFSTETHAINAELLLTASVVRYGGDISGMRVSPKAAGEDYSSWSKGVFAESLLTVLSGSSDPENVLEMLAPQDETYKALREELKDTLEQYAQDAKTRNTQIPYAGMVRPGQSGSIVPFLRKRFDLVDQDNPIYDEIVEQAVIDFQKSHGLKPDGIVGPRTIRSINEGPRDRIVKILANLERRRWIRRPMPSRFVEVNIPAMWLRAVEDNKTVFDMPVIIGRKKRETMSFVDEIVGVRFNPSWYVPSTIKKEDYLPKLREDPQALAEKGISFRVRDENGGGMVDVLPEDIDWSQVTERDLKAIQMVQGPGAANALGQIRVLMPNKYDIYLHDTNAPGLFRKDDRAQSSGCVRLSEPRRIAGFILGKNKKWSDDRLDYYLSKGKTLEIVAEQRVPVYLFYLTIWKNESGELVYGQDIYGRDEDLIKLLKNNGQIDFPMI